MTRSWMVLGVLALACSKTTPEPERDPATKPTTSTTSVSLPTGGSAGSFTTPPKSSGGGAIGPDDVSWDAPPAWTSLPNPNALRKATYKVPKTAGDSDDAELTVSAASGGVDPNVKRWAGQFGNAEPKTEPRTVNGLKVTIVEIKGTYASSPGMMGGPSTPKEKWMLLGAVVDSGDRQHFFKMTGPEKTVSASRPDFEKLVSSLRPK